MTFFLPSPCAVKPVCWVQVGGGAFGRPVIRGKRKRKEGGLLGRALQGRGRCRRRLTLRVCARCTVLSSSFSFQVSFLHPLRARAEAEWRSISHFFFSLSVAPHTVAPYTSEPQYARIGLPPAPLLLARGKRSGYGEGDQLWRSGGPSRRGRGEGEILMETSLLFSSGLQHFCAKNISLESMKPLNSRT